MQIFCVYRPYKESISKEMNNDNDLNLHSMTKLSSWLRYCRNITAKFLSCCFSSYLECARCYSSEYYQEETLYWALVSMVDKRLQNPHTNKVIKNRCIDNRHESWSSTVRWRPHNSIDTILRINFPPKH